MLAGKHQAKAVNRNSKKPQFVTTSEQCLYYFSMCRVRSI